MEEAAIPVEEQLEEEEELEEEEDERRRVLEAVFGDSSSESSEKIPLHSLPNAFHLHAEEKVDWERVEGIKGLWLCKDFLSSKQQAWLLSAIQGEGWFTETTHNQAMRFGDLPGWAINISNFIREVACSGHFGVCEDVSTGDQNMEEACPLPSDLLWREPLFDQLIINVYEEDEGICAHVDLKRFEDGIAIISLQSECVMHFTRVEHELKEDEEAVAAARGGGQVAILHGSEEAVAAARGGGQVAILHGSEEASSFTTRRSMIPVLLTPGSLVVISGEARYLWRHEIDRKQPGFQVWQGKELRQQKRTSVTLRKLVCEERMMKIVSTSNGV